MPFDWVIANPGTACAEAYLSEGTADVTCLFEGCWSVNPFVVPTWLRAHKPQRTAVLIYGVRQKQQMQRLLHKVAKLGFGWVYVTDAATAMPWDHLPNYWEQESRLASMVPE